MHEHCPICGHDIPFSLTCGYCDAGQEVASHREALDDGWHGIQQALDLPMANYIGTCPECFAALEAAK